MTYKVTSRSEQDTIELAQNIESEKFPNMVVEKLFSQKDLHLH